MHAQIKKFCTAVSIVYKVNVLHVYLLRFTRFLLLASELACTHKNSQQVCKVKVLHVPVKDPLHSFSSHLSPTMHTTDLSLHVPQMHALIKKICTAVSIVYKVKFYMYVFKIHFILFSFHLLPGKKNLAPSAVAGLAMKLDLSTVQLRKTGISDKMLMERSADITKDLPNLAVGAEYDTKHTTILLQIKGQSISSYMYICMSVHTWL